ncbi:hypothetical protein DKT68_06120 [Micromonospora acroterricola]|uniref:Uncharacterized protein n=1 Tax=Micromonospora acroterricola TaxID=2202421 RepID=A0A317DAI2_9ACTN|nr:phosphotransferase [Micromonospora acroterricola]PWR11322.1 hypothetical protein DKT68_06120 [Micromonospora acroterricola]
MTTATLTAPTGRDFGTGLLVTAVRPEPAGGYRWRRAPGPLAPAPFAPAGAELRRLLAARPAATSVRWAVGEPDDDGRTYLVRGATSVAAALLGGGPDPALAPLVHGLGQALHELHEQPLPPDVAAGRAPRGLVRFTRWLDGRSPHPRSAYAESLLRSRLGAAALARVREHTARIAAADERVLCHGAPGLGSLIPAEGEEAGADALIGEDVCAAPWYYDLGWVLGELVELQWYLGGDRPAWQRLTNALLDGYGRDLDDRWRETVAFRVLLHVHDYTTYVGWEPKVFEKYTGFARHLLSP